MKTNQPPETLVLRNSTEESPAVQTNSAPAPIAILEAAIKGGVTQENISVVKELIQMCREQRAEDSKAAFAKAFFRLRKNMPEIYADKEAHTKSGQVAYVYCSEKEILSKLDPHLMSFGFAMLFSQSENDGRITVEITLMHEAGHSEVKTFTVRAGAPNAMKDAASCDAGAATTAWRHLVMKLFSLKSRISENQDARNEGEPITRDQAQVLSEMVKDTAADEVRFLAFAGAKTYEEIPSLRYAELFAKLNTKARR